MTLRLGASESPTFPSLKECGIKPLFVPMPGQSFRFFLSIISRVLYLSSVTYKDVLARWFHKPFGLQNAIRPNVPRSGVELLHCLRDCGAVQTVPPEPINCPVALALQLGLLDSPSPLETRSTG